MKNKNILTLIKYFIVFMFIVILPFSIGIPNQSRERLIVLNLSIDKIGTQYEFAIEYLVPQSSSEFKDQTDIISAKGENIATAIEHIEMNIGKTIGLSHASSIIVSKEVMSDNIFQVVDYFIRDNAIGKYTIFIGTDNNAKELLKSSKQAKEKNLNSPSGIISYNDVMNLEGISTLHTYLEGYYSKSKTSTINMLSLEENLDEQSSSNSIANQNSNGSDSVQSNSNATKSIKNIGQSALFYDGKFVDIIDGDANKGVGLIQSPFKHATLTLNNLNDDTFKNATVSLSLNKMEVKKELKIYNNPSIIYNLKFKIKILSIVDEGEQKKFYKENSSFVNNTILLATKEKLQSYVDSAIEKAREMRVDLFEINELFNKYKNKDWNNYLNNLESERDYIQNVKIFTNFDLIVE